MFLGLWLMFAKLFPNFCVLGFSCWGLIGHYRGVSYFTAAMSTSPDGWHSHDVPIDELADIDELVDQLRFASQSDGPCFAFIEHEDEWFGVVRVDDTADPEVFISDAVAVTRGHYAPLFEALVASSSSIDLGEPELVAASVSASAGASESTSAGTDAGGESAVGAVVIEATRWEGTSSIFADFGLPASDFEAILTEFDGDPGTALAEVADRLGCSDVLEGLR